MYFGLSVSWWLVLPLAVLAGVLLIRIFIIFHDCGHGSFFSSTRANQVVGFLCGLLVLTPYRQWHGDHADHHATAGNLDGRGPGEVWTMTVVEFQQANPWTQRMYRLMRNPVFLFGIVPTLFFVVLQRFPSRATSRHLKQSVWVMNVAAAAQAGALMAVFGVVPYLILQTIVIAVAGGAGFWLFYVQHQFEDVQWKRGRQWTYASAALHGSSYYKLPLALKWCTGNIGFHHVHHLFPRIPNYHLEKCHHLLPAFRDVPVLTLKASLGTMKLKLWDENAGRMVRFKDIHQVQAIGKDDAGSIVVHNR